MTELAVYVQQLEGYLVSTYFVCTTVIALVLSFFAAGLME